MRVLKLKVSYVVFLEKDVTWTSTSAKIVAAFPLSLLTPAILDILYDNSQSLTTGQYFQY